MDIDVTGILERPVVTISEKVLNENEVWRVLQNQTVLGVIGPSSDFTNEGTINIDGDVVFLCLSGHGFVSVDGTVNLGNNGTLTLIDI